MKIHDMLGDRILVDVIKDEGEAKTQGGIILPEIGSLSPRFWVGKIVNMGPGTLLPDGAMYKPNINIGDSVLVPKGGQELTLDGHEYRLYQMMEVICTLD